MQRLRFWSPIINHYIELSLGVLTLYAFWLRLDRLTEEGLWFDEGLSVIWARRSLPALLSTSVYEDIHPPLHYLLLHFWMLVAGQSEFAVRFLSVVLGLLLVPLTFALVRELYAADTPARWKLLAAGAAGLVGLSPFLVYYSRETRMYALLIVLSTAMLWALLHATRTASRRAWIAYAFLLALSLYTHYSALLLLVITVAFALVLGREIACRWVRYTGIAMLLYSPWLPAVYLQATRFIRTPDFYPGELEVSTTLASFATAALPSVAPALSLGLLAALLVLLGGRLVRQVQLGLASAQRESLILMAGVLPVALLALVMTRVPKFEVRYAIIAIVPLYISLVIGLAALISGYAHQRLLLLILLLVGAIVTLGSQNVSVGNDLPGVDRRREDARGLSAYLSANVRPNDAILLVDDTPYAFQYYYRGQALWYGLHVGFDFELAAQKLNEILAIRPQRIWLAQWRPNWGDPTDMVVTELRRVGREVPVNQKFHNFGLRAFDIETFGQAVKATPTPTISFYADFAGGLSLQGYEP